MPSCPAGTAATRRPIEIASMCYIMRYTGECTHTIISLGCGRLMLRYMQCYLPWSSQTLPQMLLLSVLPSNNWFNWMPWTMVRQRRIRTNSRTRITHYKPEKQRCEHEDFCNAIVASPMLRYILFWTTYQTFRSHLRPAINLYAMGSIRQSATDNATSTFTSC